MTGTSTNISRCPCYLPIVGRLVDICTFRMRSTINTLHVPFTTVVTLLSMICVSIRISAAAIRASSCVNLSNRFSAPSISFIPTSFFRNFPEGRLAMISLVESNALARPCLISLVAIAKMFNTSIIIFVIMSVIASVGCTAV